MDYENNEEIRSYVRCLPTIAFVPPDDVEEDFELLAESQTVQQLDELTSFFEHAYVRGSRRRGLVATYCMFPVATLNQHAAGSDAINGSTNAVEGWHHRLQSLFLSHHHTV